MVKQYTIQEFLDTTNFMGASFSPDNRKILVSSDATGIFNAYAIPIVGGDPVQLTHSTKNYVFVQGYFPHDERFLFTSDEGGNELNHLYVRELDGSTTDLTPGEKLKAAFSGWAKDDRSCFVSTNERDQRYFDLYEITLDDYQRTLVFQNDQGFSIADVSPDRRYILLAKVETNADSDIYLHDRDSGETRHLTPHTGNVNHSPTFFSPDGTSIYFVTDEDSEFKYLVRCDLAGKNRQVVEQVDWDIMFAQMSKGGQYLVIGINSDARTDLHIYETATMQPISLPSLPDADITSVSISRDETHFAFYASNSRMPQDLFASNFVGTIAEQLTHSLNPNINPDDLVDAEVVRFTSYDGVEIPGILYHPHQADRANKAPALVWVHGGPGGQSRVGYADIIQFLVNHGYVIYAINNRGSSGYGKTFFHMDDRKHGDADLDDCVASKQMLIDTGTVDPGRIGIIGGSYGGYMVLAALTFRPDVFAVGVDIFGISNWLRTLENIPPWWESFRKSLEAEMGPFDDQDYFKRISPLFHAENIVKPLIVLQGANDPRVIKAESDDIVAAVRNNGVPVEYIVFDDEGHGFVKKENKAHGFQAILEFVDQYLK